MTRFKRISLSALLSLACAAPALAQEPADLVKAELLADTAQAKPGEPFMAAVRLRMKQHWHVYWRNPGDSGLAPEIRWTLPDGYRAGEIEWPVPQRIPVSHLVNFGYENEVMLLARITPPANAAAPAVIKADVSWLVCERECILGEAALSLDLPSRGADKAAFDAAKSRLPRPAPKAGTASVTGDTVTVRVPLAGTVPKPAFFFPDDETLIRHADPQKIAAEGNDIVIAMARSALSRDVQPVIRGTLRLDGAPDAPGYLVEAALQGAAPPVSVPAAAAQPAIPPSADSLRETAAPFPQPLDIAMLFQAIAFALIGGLILNLMPCVFPVLSLKVLHLARHSRGSRAAMRAHGIAYTAGVLATFLALAALLMALRAGGAEVGWGYQLQSPLVVVALAYLFFAMALSLSGYLHFGMSLGGIGGKLTEKAGPEGAFFSGMLATIVATPCTAPFMGTALGVALTQSPAVGVAIFASLGLGLALPFLILSFAPALQKKLPRPGAWMQTLQQALAFPLYATVAWLVWVVSQQIGSSGLFAVLIGFVAIALAAWLWHFAPLAGATARRALGAGALACLAAVAGLAIAAGNQRIAPSAASEADAFTQARLDALRAEGRAVFVNMTAAWCITCLVNERTALASRDVRTAMADRNIVYLKGDWTNRNPEITRLLARHKRSGVPLYLYYAPGAPEPAVLPQILTRTIVLDAFTRNVAANAAAAQSSSTQ